MSAEKIGRPCVLYGKARWKLFPIGVGQGSVAGDPAMLDQAFPTPCQGCLRRRVRVKESSPMRMHNNAFTQLQRRMREKRNTCSHVCTRVVYASHVDVCVGRVLVHKSTDMY